VSIEKFIDSPLGKPIVGILTCIARITVRKTADGEKTPLDTPKGTVIAGILLLGATIIAVRIAAIV